MLEPSYLFFQLTVVSVILAIIWILAILAILPVGIFARTQQIFFDNTQLVISEVCHEDWPDPTIHLIYSISLMALQYLIPISVILITHTMILRIVQRRIHSTVATGVTIRKNKKTTQILVIIAMTFGIQWLPFHIYTIGT